MRHYSKKAALQQFCQGVTQPWSLPGPTGMFRADPALKLDPATMITWVAQGCVQLGFKHLQEWRLLVRPVHLFQSVTTLMMKKNS